MKTISRDEVNQMLENDGIALVEVLSAEKYADFHLPDAINVPLDDDFDTEIAKAVPDKTKPIIVYCYDSDCPASEKAASRMEELGYQEVYDYEAGKVDWKAAKLPFEA